MLQTIQAFASVRLRVLHERPLALSPPGCVYVRACDRACVRARVRVRFFVRVCTCLRAGMCACLRARVRACLRVFACVRAGVCA